jgi:hypothetical protein
MQLLMAEAAASGALDPLDDHGSTGTADADSTRFLLDTGEVEVSFSVYDLGRGEGPDGELTGEQIEARAELTELRTTLRDFESLLGPEVLAGGQTVAADAVAILAREGGSDPSFELPFDVESDGTEIQTRAGPVSCLIVTGDDLAGLTQALSTVEAGPYRSGRMGAQVWTFAFRPMLPDEAGCAQLGS